MTKKQLKLGAFMRPISIEGATLRENLGLPRPENRFFAARSHS